MSDKKTFLDFLEEACTGSREALHEPPDAVGPEETVIGRFENERGRAIFSLRQSILGAAVKEEALLSAATTPSEREYLGRMALLHQRQVSALSDIFWIAVFDEFPQLYGHAFGIRAGWQVVTRDAPKRCATTIPGAMGLTLSGEADDSQTCESPKGRIVVSAQISIPVESLRELLRSIDEGEAPSSGE